MTTIEKILKENDLYKELDKLHNQLSDIYKDIDESLGDDHWKNVMRVRLSPDINDIKGKIKLCREEIALLNGELDDDLAEIANGIIEDFKNLTVESYCRVL